jgi:orotidine-5'-phosphate decarboxylase
LASISARDRLIVALDFPTVAEARALVARLGPAVTFYKIGLELVMAGGLDLARELAGAGKKTFLDMKLLDIENTVERATRNAAAAGATFLTVHALDTKTRRAALARDAGCDGVVASGLEAARVRAIVGPHMAIVTPGIRLPDDAVGDQARVAGPEQAIEAGADYLVVGRPIAAAKDPAGAAELFVQAIEEGLAMRALGPPG